MAKDARMIILMEEKTKDKFAELAEKMGTTMSSLGAHVIGQWVYQQNSVMELMERQMKDVIASEMAKGDKG
jgi:hypothetical protein